MNGGSEGKLIKPLICQSWGMAPYAQIDETMHHTENNPGHLYVRAD